MRKTNNTGNAAFVILPIDTSVYYHRCHTNVTEPACPTAHFVVTPAEIQKFAQRLPN